jgi:hypothetical protein
MRQSKSSDVVVIHNASMYIFEIPDTLKRHRRLILLFESPFFDGANLAFSFTLDSCTVKIIHRHASLFL